MLRRRNLTRFAHLTFDDFRNLAKDSSLSRYEKIGFPDEYREGFESHILQDIRQKLPAIDACQKQVLDIGPGCSELPLMIADICRSKEHQLTWIDNAEMLSHLPDAPFIHKIPARFPDCADLIKAQSESFDAILAYSVLHYVVPGSDIFAFYDAALSLLAPSGALLLGDIPNVSRRNRFFASENGRRFHHRFTGSDSAPIVTFNALEPKRIDDSILLSLVLHGRAAGFHAYIVPQNEALPMANRREDVLVVRP